LTLVQKLPGIPPTLEYHVDASSDLKWKNLDDPDVCRGSLIISPENKGVRGFDMSSFRIRGWIYSLTSGSQSPTESLPIAIDYAPLFLQTPFKDLKFTDRDKPKPVLIAHYPTGTGYEETYDWVFKKVKGKGVLFLTTFVSKDGKGDFIPPVRIADDICPVPEGEAKAIPSDKLTPAVKPSRSDQR
jgi:hypothetical protein